MGEQRKNVFLKEGLYIKYPRGPEGPSMLVSMMLFVTQQ